MEDAAIIGAFAGVLTAIIAFGTFWLTIGGKMQKALSSSESALQVAAEAETKVDAADQRITTLAANFSLYRENAIEKFVTHQFLNELEKRLIESHAKTEQRMIDGLDGVNSRLDQLFNAAFKRG